MPELVTYRGRPVKRRQQQKGRLKLTFFSAIPGKEGGSEVVTQRDWDKHGLVQFFEKDQMPDIRELARRKA